MKKIFNLQFAKHIKVVAVAAAMMSSCTGAFEDINTNPNSPAETDANYVFNHLIKEGAGEFTFVNNYSYNYFQRWTMQTAAVWGNSTMPPYTLFDDYRISNLWEFYYSNLGVNATVLEQMTETESNAKHQVARIWKVYGFHRVTDLWGDVPYFEAWEIFDPENINIQPKYDKQEDIYAHMIETLRDASTQLTDPTDVFYNDDLLFGGDITKWRKFANSLCLRLAIRSGNDAVIQELIDEDVFMESNDDNALFYYLDNTSYWSPYWSLHENSKESQPKISELMFLELDGKSDPRLEYYAEKNEVSDTYVGVPNLMDSNLKENQALGMGSTSTSYMRIYNPAEPNSPEMAPNQVFNYAELCFLRAEAAFTGVSNDDAKNWFEKGVEASMSYYGIDQTEIDAYLQSEEGKYIGTLEQIITQKWVANYLNGYEVFAEYRRTGFPQLMKYDLELDGRKIITQEWVEVSRSYVPGRVPYPMNESDLNGDNYQEAVNNMGGEDDYFSQVWWSAKAGQVNY